MRRKSKGKGRRRENLYRSLSLAEHLLEIKNAEVQYFEDMSRLENISDELVDVLQGLAVEANISAINIRSLLEVLEEREAIFGKYGLKREMD